MNRLFPPDHESILAIHERLSTDEVTGKPLPALVTVDQVSDLVEVSFWASLRTDEGRGVHFCATIQEALKPQSKLATRLFAAPVPFDESHVAKLAPAVPKGECLVISAQASSLMITGFAATPLMPEMSLTVRVSEIGIVRVSVGYSEPFATFSGRENTIFGGMTRWALATYLHICLYGPPRDRPYATSVHALTILNLVDAIASEGHGGALLFVDEENGTWEKAIDPFPYRFAEPDTTIPTTLSDEFLLLSARYVAETVMRASDDVSDELVRLILKRLTSSVWEESECVRRSARFAAADGAIVMTKALKIVGFGAKISAEAVVPSVCFYRPDTEAHERISLERCGGTRHQSAVRFVNAVRDAVALVISQDRHVSLLHWSEKLDAVAIVSNAQWMM